MTNENQIVSTSTGGTIIMLCMKEMHLGAQTIRLIAYNIGLLSLKDCLLLLGVLPAAVATVNDTTISWRVLWNFKGKTNLFFSGIFLFTCFSVQPDKALNVLVLRIPFTP